MSARTMSNARMQTALSLVAGIVCPILWTSVSSIERKIDQMYSPITTIDRKIDGLNHKCESQASSNTLSQSPIVSNGPYASGRSALDSESPAICFIRILGDCAKFPDVPNRVWFDDASYGGKIPTSSQDCEHRRQSWASSCTSSVSAWFAQRLGTEIPSSAGCPVATPTVAAPAQSLAYVTKPRATDGSNCMANGKLPLECAWSTVNPTIGLANSAANRVWARLVQNGVLAREPVNVEDIYQTLNEMYGKDSALSKVGLPNFVLPEHVHVIPMGGEPYFKRSIRDSDLVMEGFVAAGVVPQPSESWLDFGGSHGRVTRLLASAFPETNWHCSDPVPSSIEWGRDNVPNVKFYVSEQNPPMAGYADETFTGIYAISIWSHYNAEGALAWFKEMHRILKPGGVLWFSTHGYQALNFAALEGAVLHPVELRHKMMEDLYVKGHFYFPMFGDKGDWNLKDGAGGAKWGYGAMTTEWLATYVLNAKGSPAWTLAQYAPGRSEKHQDVYVLRKAGR